MGNYNTRSVYFARAQRVIYILIEQLLDLVLRTWIGALYSIYFLSFDSDRLLNTHSKS
jgi:hypothetical protein